MKPRQTIEPPKKNRKWIIVVVVLVLGYFAFSFLPFLTPLFFEWRSGDKAEKDLEMIAEMIKPGPARDYQFHSPSPEAAKRTINCKNLSAWQEELPIITPLCLNLYKTSPEEINRKVAEGKYDRIILYGEKIIWDAPVIRGEALENLDLGKAVYDSARFNDQVTVPKLMALFGWDNLSFVNRLTPNKIFPFPALYFRLSNDEEVQAACGNEGGDLKIGGCALGMWSTVIPQSVLFEKMSLANQKVWRISEEKNPDYLVFDYKWPANCYADDVMIHEIAHTLLYAYRIYNPPQALVATKYFNEHLADTVKVYGTNLICGSGSVSNFRDKSGKEMSLADFNSTYPPAKMGSAWPDTKHGCQLAMLNGWNTFITKGDFEKQFGAFGNALKSWMQAGKTIFDDKGLQNFIIQLNSNDENTKRELQYRGCFL